MWFVYMLRCRDGALYIGETNDVDLRLVRHNDARLRLHLATTTGDASLRGTARESIEGAFSRATAQTLEPSEEGSAHCRGPRGPETTLIHGRTASNGNPTTSAFALAPQVGPTQLA